MGIPRVALQELRYPAVSVRHCERLAIRHQFAPTQLEKIRENEAPSEPIRALDLEEFRQHYPEIPRSGLCNMAQMAIIAGKAWDIVEVIICLMVIPQPMSLVQQPEPLGPDL